MHLLFLTRGHTDWIDYFIKELSTRYFLTNVWNPQTRKIEQKHFKARLQPIQLWDLVFPEEYKDPVLNSVFGGFDGKGVSSNQHLQKYLTPLRWTLGYQPIPDYDKSKSLIMQPPMHTEVIGIGLKEDKYCRDGDGKIVDREERGDKYAEAL